MTNAIDRSKTSAPSERTTTPFMLRNPFKKVDWITVWIVLALTGGAVLFVMSMRLVSSAT